MGLNEADRLKAAGIEAKKASVTRMRVNQLALLAEGPTAHPRAGLPPDPGLVSWIKANGMVGLDGVPWRFLCRELGLDGDGVMQIEVGNGSRRANAALLAEEQLRSGAPRQAPLHFKRDDPSDLGRLFVDVELFSGTDAEFILARLAANSEPGKLPDSTEVLAVTVAQLLAAGCTEVDEIVAVMPAGVRRKEVQALARWENLTKEARLYIVEHDLPPGLLPAILDAHRTEQLSTAMRLHAAGVKSAAGATRKIRQDREERTGEPASKARRWNPAKLVRCARAISVPSKVILPDEEQTMSPEDIAKLVDDAEARGFAKALLFAAGEKTGKIPVGVRTAIKAVNGQGKAIK